MFYFSDDGWKPFTKKITFTETVEVYGDDPDAYTGKPDLFVEDVLLTDEQMRRLEIIRRIQSIGLDDVRKYVLEGILEDDSLLEVKREIDEEATREKLKTYVPWDELTTEQMESLLENFKEYSVGAFYLVGDVFKYMNQLYKVVQTHTSQADWIPPQVPALYTPIAPPPSGPEEPEIIAQWVQPLGGHDAYQIGDKVLYNGLVYESTAPDNVWPPDVYGWVLVP